MAAEGSPRVMSDEEVAALEVFGPDEPDGRVPAGYIYVLQEGGPSGQSGYYKLGSSGNLKKRLGDLQTGNPRHLEILDKWPVKDMTNAEAQARKAVEPYAATLGGGREWYYVTTNTKAFLDAINDAVAGR